MWRFEPITFYIGSLRVKLILTIYPRPFLCHKGVPFLSKHLDLILYVVGQKFRPKPWKTTMSENLTWATCYCKNILSTLVPNNLELSKCLFLVHHKGPNHGDSKFQIMISIQPPQVKLQNVFLNQGGKKTNSIGHGLPHLDNMMPHFLSTFIWVRREEEPKRGRIRFPMRRRLKLWNVKL